MCGAVLLERANVVVESVEAVLPDVAVLFCPVRHGVERFGIERAWAILGPLASGDQARVFQHFDVFGNRWKGEIERRRDVVDACLSFGQVSQDRTPGRVGQCCERCIEAIIVQCLGYTCQRLSLLYSPYSYYFP